MKLRTKMANLLFHPECPAGCTGQITTHKVRSVRNLHYPDFTLLPSGDPIINFNPMDQINALKNAKTPAEKAALEDQYDREADLQNFYQYPNYISRYGYRYIHTHKDDSKPLLKLPSNLSAKIRKSLRTTLYFLIPPSLILFQTYALITGLFFHNHAMQFILQAQALFLTIALFAWGFTGA